MECLNLIGIRHHVGLVLTLDGGTVHLRPNLDVLMIEKMNGGYLLDTTQMVLYGCQTDVLTFTFGKTTLNHYVVFSSYLGAKDYPQCQDSCHPL